MMEHSQSYTGLVSDELTKTININAYEFWINPKLVIFTC